MHLVAREASVACGKPEVAPIVMSPAPSIQALPPYVPATPVVTPGAHT